MQLSDYQILMLVFVSKKAKVTFYFSKYNLGYGTEKHKMLIIRYLCF